MPSSPSHFDAIIIGSGTSAYYAADTLLEAGRSLAMIDERPFGGTCALRGCQPKKYLVANAEAVALADHLVGKGIVESPRTDWAALQQLKNEFLDGKPEREIEEWKQRGVTTIRGTATLSAEDEVTVNGDKLTAGHIILATGSTPRTPDIPGAEFIRKSSDFLDLPSLPERIVFLGGGYISFEFAHVAIRAGAKEVTILHRSEQPLKGFDCDVVRTVVAASEDAGIRVHTNEAPTSVEQNGESFVVHTSTGSCYEADFVMAAIGRSPNLDALKGDAAGVATSRHGIEVNDFLQSTTNPRVYAIGDCAATRFMLAPVADLEGKTAARNILEGNQHRIDYSVVPSAVFTIPSVGSVGLTEQQATDRKLDFRIIKGTTSGWPSSKRIGETHGAYKVLVDNQSDLLLGAHLVRHNASEAVNVLALAMKAQITASDFATLPWAYPTSTSDLKYMFR